MISLGAERWRVDLTGRAEWSSKMAGLIGQAEWL